MAIADELQRLVVRLAAETPPWEKEAPKGSKDKKMSDSQVAAAKRRAREAGRPYPNLVDNMAVMGKKAAEAASKKRLKDPEGGLTAAGRAHFKRTEGANLKPGVKGPADTPEKMRRKGSFLSRMFGPGAAGSMQKPNGQPTRRALSARAWGEPLPKNDSDRAALYAKGQRLLERYKATKKSSHDEYDANSRFLHDPSEVVDPAGGMAKSKLHRIEDMAGSLEDIIQHNDQLPPWVQDHIAATYENLDQVYGYIEPRAAKRASLARFVEKFAGREAKIRAEQRSKNLAAVTARQQSSAMPRPAAAAPTVQVAPAAENKPLGLAAASSAFPASRSLVPAGTKALSPSTASRSLVPAETKALSPAPAPPPRTGTPKSLGAAAAESAGSQNWSWNQRGPKAPGVSYSFTSRGPTGLEPERVQANVDRVNVSRGTSAPGLPASAASPLQLSGESPAQRVTSRRMRHEERRRSAQGPDADVARMSSGGIPLGHAAAEAAAPAPPTPTPTATAAPEVTKTPPPSPPLPPAGEASTPEGSPAVPPATPAPTENEQTSRWLTYGLPLGAMLGLGLAGATLPWRKDDQYDNLVYAPMPNYYR